MSKNVYLTLGDKGGIGKTFTAKVLRDWFKLLNRTASCFDLDTENGSFYGYDKDSIKLCDFSDKLGWLDAVYNSSASQIIVDVPGGKVAELAATLDAGIPALQKAVKDAGRELIAVQPIGVMRDSTLAAQSVLESFGAGGKVVVVKNGFFGKPEDFVIFDGIELANGERQYGATGELAKQVGAQIVYLPRLASVTAAILDMEGVTLFDAGRSQGRLGYRHALNASSYLSSAIEGAFSGTWLDPRPSAAEVAL